VVTSIAFLWAVLLEDALELEETVNSSLVRVPKNATEPHVAQGSEAVVVVRCRGAKATSGEIVAKNAIPGLAVCNGVYRSEAGAALFAYIFDCGSDDAQLEAEAMEDTHKLLAAETFAAGLVAVYSEQMRTARGVHKRVQAMGGSLDRVRAETTCVIATLRAPTFSFGLQRAARAAVAAA
jgi:hypothetical protein